MSVDLERRRVLIAAAPRELAPLLELFARGHIDGWEAEPAESFEQVHFLLQHDDCDVLLIDQSLYHSEEAESLMWLARHQAVVYLAGPDPLSLTAVLDGGASQWLPRELALSHPSLLAAVLNQTASRGDMRRNHRRVGEALQECRRQVHRLVTLLWSLSPTEAHPRWFTQRHMMDRLGEEIARTQRHGTPLSVALGEVRVGDELLPTTERPQVMTWTAERITHCKRRTDVAGQYGPHGFILLLSQTPAPGAAVCCRRLRRALEDGAEASAPPAPIEAFFGISTYAAGAANAKSLLGRAEERLEQARQEQNDHIVF